MSDLKRVVKLAELLKAKTEQVKSLDAELKQAKQDLNQLEREDLPTLMEELGLTELKLNDGSKVSIKEQVDAAITEKKREPALRWLLDNGYGGLIKTEVTIGFNRGERDEAASVAERLREDHPGVAMKEVVHPSTLKAFVKERMQAGEEIPFDLFSIHPYSKATITNK